MFGWSSGRVVIEWCCIVYCRMMQCGVGYGQVSGRSRLIASGRGGANELMGRWVVTVAASGLGEACGVVARL